LPGTVFAKVSRKLDTLERESYSYFLHEV